MVKWPDDKVTLNHLVVDQLLVKTLGVIFFTHWSLPLKKPKKLSMESHEGFNPFSDLGEIIPKHEGKPGFPW